MRLTPRKHVNAQRIVAALFLVLIGLSIFGALKSPVAASLINGARITFLIFGIDAADMSQHTDTLMVSVLDPVREILSVVSIPRDTRVFFSGFKFHRINEIYGYHLRKSKDRNIATQYVLDGISSLLSKPGSKLTLSNFVMLDFSGFQKMIDIVGGVWIQVQNPMNYDDFAGNYHFHKEPGRYLMNGDEALHYVRYRGHTGDKGRILRQQEFVRTLAKRLVNPFLLFKFPKIVEAATSSFNTNFSFWDMVYLAVAGRKVRSQNLDFYILPGQPKGVYWYLKQESLDNLVAHVLLGQELNKELFEVIVPQANVITVKVWNASGRSKVALQVTKFLRKQGFDVVDWDTYSMKQPASRVIDRTGELANAKKVAEVLGVDDFHSEMNPKSMVDVEVVIGSNFQMVGLSDNF